MSSTSAVLAPRRPLSITPASVIIVCVVALVSIGLTVLFSASSPIKGGPYAYLYKQFIFLAIAIGFAQAGVARISQELDEVARMLGAGPARLARSIHLPLARPALLGSALLIFVDCLKELPATLVLRPLNVETLSTYIYQFATRGNFEEGSLAALIIVAFGVLPVILITRYADMSTMVGRGEN